jgi:hypothetical protein
MMMTVRYDEYCYCSIFVAFCPRICYCLSVLMVLVEIDGDE